MAKIFNFDDGLSFEALARRFEYFHDWIVQDVTIFAVYAEGYVDCFPAQYDGKISLFDPYDRFNHKIVSLKLNNVSSVSLAGLIDSNKEISNMNITIRKSKIIFEFDVDLLKFEADSVLFSLQ